MKKQKQEKRHTSYCRHCGAEMIVKTRPQIYNQYDTETGKPTNKVYTHAKCPNKRIFLDAHSEWDDEQYSDP